MRSYGFRSKTRKLFTKGFKEHGKPHIARILEQFRMGDMVDCVVDPSIVKGMPHKYYHGKTGVVFNCNPRSYGVIFTRRVGGKYIERQMHIRVEHLRRSRCMEDTARRYAAWNEKLREARARGEKAVPEKRQPVGPRPAFTVQLAGNEPVEVAERKVYIRY